MSIHFQVEFSIETKGKYLCQAGGVVHKRRGGKLNILENKTCRIRKLGEIIVRLDLEENVDRGKFVKLLETT